MSTRSVTNELTWWKDLRRVCRKGERGNWFDDNIYWKVGTKSRILFWDDMWLRDMCLRDRYHKVFSSSNQKGVKVKEGGGWHGNHWEWNLTWRRNWFEREKLLTKEFVWLVHRSSMHRENKDESVWKEDEKLEYTLKSTYKKLRNETIRENEEVYDKLCKIKSLPTTQLCLWRVLRNKLATY